MITKVKVSCKLSFYHKRTEGYRVIYRWFHTKLGLYGCVLPQGFILWCYFYHFLLLASRKLKEYHCQMFFQNISVYMKDSLYPITIINTKTVNMKTLVEIEPYEVWTPLGLGMSRCPTLTLGTCQKSQTNVGVLHFYIIGVGVTVLWHAVSRYPCRSLCFIRHKIIVLPGLTIWW